MLTNPNATKKRRGLDDPLPLPESLEVGRAALVDIVGIPVVIEVIVFHGANRKDLKYSWYNEQKIILQKNQSTVVSSPPWGDAFPWNPAKSGRNRD